jgi:hypothetical protein
MPPLKKVSSTSGANHHAIEAQGAILLAIETVNDRVGELNTSVTNIASQVDELKKGLIDEVRVSKMETKIDTLEKAHIEDKPQKAQMALDIAAIKTDIKPVIQYVYSLKFLFPIVMGLGGILTAVITAVLLKTLGIRL